MKQISAPKKIALQVLGFILGFIISAMTIFTILFFMKVIPHGGI